MKKLGWKRWLAIFFIWSIIVGIEVWTQLTDPKVWGGMSCCFGLLALKATVLIICHPVDYTKAPCTDWDVYYGGG